MKKPILALLVVIAAIGISMLITSINSSTTITPIQNESTNVSQNNQDTNKTQNSGITLQELEKHNNKADCWVLYKGKVYDISSWITKHPGGVGAISPYCGNTGFESAFVAQHGTGKASLFLSIAKLMGDFNEQGALI